MKVRIGLEDKKIDFYKLLLARKKKMLGSSTLWKTKAYNKDKIVFCEIETSDENLINICIVLADIIIENLEIRYFVNILKKEYYFLSEKEQCEILVFSLNNIWKNSEYGMDINQAKIEVSKRLKIIFDETDEITLEGFMRFRMKDYLSDWRDILTASINHYLMEQEYKEFIKVLKYFVEIRKPKINTIHITIGNDGKFIILDDFLKVVHDDALVYNSKESDLALTNEDVLLSMLVSIAPNKIIVHNADKIEDKLLIDTIKRIFIDKVKFSNDII